MMRDPADFSNYILLWVIQSTMYKTMRRDISGMHRNRSFMVLVQLLRAQEICQSGSERYLKYSIKPWSGGLRPSVERVLKWGIRLQGTHGLKSPSLWNTWGAVISESVILIDSSAAKPSHTHIEPQLMLPKSHVFIDLNISHKALPDHFPFAPSSNHSSGPQTRASPWRFGLEIID